MLFMSYIKCSIVNIFYLFFYNFNQDFVTSVCLPINSGPFSVPNTPVISFEKF